MKNNLVRRLSCVAFAMAFLGCLAGPAAAEESGKAGAAEEGGKAGKTMEYTDLAGRWVYRSIKNIADPAEDLSKMKLLVGIIEIAPFTGNHFTGTLTATNFGKDIRHILQGEIKGDRFTMTALPGNDTTEGWLYNYTGWLVPKWKDGVSQVPTFVGSVMRVTEHVFPGGGMSTSGASYTIVGMKQVK